MEDPRAAQGVRFAGLVASDPSLAIRIWKALSGRKAVGCPPRFPVPEILHCVGMLPALARHADELRYPGSPVDGWVLPPQEPWSRGTVEALDWVESLAEWAEGISGRLCTEGALWRSLASYRERDALLGGLTARCAETSGFLDPPALCNVIDSGRFLPVEAHAALLGRIMGALRPAAEREGEGMEPGGDPFLALARRIAERREMP